MTLLQIFSTSLLLVFTYSALPGDASPTHIYSKRSSVSRYPALETQASSCTPGQVPNSAGQCTTPEIKENVFLFDIPQVHKPKPQPYIPSPKVINNILFVNLPETLQEPEPLVIPPPRQESVVYILNKKKQDSKSKVIEIPAPPKTNPEVYFVNYGPGENPVLPTGESLLSVFGNSEKGFTRILSSEVQSSSAINPLNNIDNVTGEEVSSNSLSSTADTNKEYKPIFYNDVEGRIFFHP